MNQGVNRIIDEYGFYSCSLTSPRWLVFDPSLVGPHLKPYDYEKGTTKEVLIQVACPSYFLLATFHHSLYSTSTL